jgi:hypothetical protein
MAFKMKGWSPFAQKPKVRSGNIYVGDKKFSDKPMYEGQKPSTHLMAYGESDGKFVAFPTLFQDDDGTWQQPDNAFREAIKRKEIYQFNTEQEAKDFADGSWKNK